MEEVTREDVVAKDVSSAPVAYADADELRLSQLGYKQAREPRRWVAASWHAFCQELKRGFSALANFGMSFSVVSFLTSLTASFGTAWFWGGPISALYGWLIASFFTLVVALSMAEICSSYPTSGGLYYWAAQLGGTHRVFASWLAGWFNLLGQVAITAGVGMATTNSIVAMAVMGGSPARANRHGGLALATWHGFVANAVGIPGPLVQADPCPFDENYQLVTANPWPYPDITGKYFGTYSLTAGNVGVNTTVGGPENVCGVPPCVPEVAFSVAECLRKPLNFTQPQIYAIYVGLIFLVAAMNSFSVNALNMLTYASIFWHIAGSLVIIIGLPIVARKHLSASLIWQTWAPFNNINKDGVNAFPQYKCLNSHTHAAHFDYTHPGGSSDGNTPGGNYIFGCPLYGTQAVPAGRTIFQANKNGGFVANGAINWGFNGINKFALGYSEDGATNGGVNAYIFFCGLLMSQWCYTGYDASAHVAEETKDAARAGPQGIISCILVTFVFGLAYLVSLISSIQDMNNSYGGPFALSYSPTSQLMWDAFETRYGNGRYCLGFWIIPLMAQFFCTVSSITSNSRMLYAFARDDAVPGSRVWHVINKRAQIPVNAVWGMSVAAMLIALPTVQSVEAFSAVTSIATIGLYVSYIIPIFCRITIGRKVFSPGPFTLGRLGIPIGTVATLWVVVICVFFTMPNTFPIDMTLNFNYAIIAVGVVLCYSLGTWFLPGPKPLNARVWFKGPQMADLHTERVLDGGPGASFKEAVKPPPVPAGV